jgi:hypothetical protein
MGPRLLSMLHFLASMLRSLMIVIMTKKEKQTNKRSFFSQTVELISLLVPSPMTRLSFRTNLASP